MGSVELFPTGKCESCRGEERKDEKIEKMPEEEPSFFDIFCIQVLFCSFTYRFHKMFHL